MADFIPIGTLIRQRYLIQQVLGQGGFGRTYLALDQERFGEGCVLKEFIVPYADEALLKKARTLFQREASTLHQIQHPQIPQFQAAFESDDRLWLVQSLVEGKTYRTWLNQRKAQGSALSESEVLLMLGKLLPVLSYLHDRRIIHRDISPDNIILQPQSSTTDPASLQGTPVLIDFGAVKEATSGLALVSSMTRVGKIGYAPPEQLQTGSVHPHSDLYALAATCLVLLTGREPQDLLDSHSLTWCWQPYTQISDRLAQVLLKMLSLHPGDRYQSAQEVWVALQPMLAGLPMTQMVVPPTAMNPHPTSPATSTNPRTAPAAQATPKSRRPTVQVPLAMPQISSMSAILASLVVVLGVGTWIFRLPIPSGTTHTLQSDNAVASTVSADLALNANGTQTILFKPGEISALVQGTLQDKPTQTYRLRAAKGQIMSVILDGSGVVMNLLKSNQEPIDGASQQTRSWTGQLPLDDEYELQITGSGSYAIDVSITPLTRSDSAAAPKSSVEKNPTNTAPKGKPTTGTKQAVRQVAIKQSSLDQNRNPGLGAQ
ncbi:serine/threonine-protein kinase [Alkalinema sp. FACHB-956]|uniref:serine/threonine-protein kinase n=1 Tax=Alkalinema sp. FACHB-956 TaxID=2692768 RepID=UPI0016858027|nr:serine/threonine-protein kinase [Alkalinema sp. FACHB-956]MBD2325874.1 protein kinase [Alkalinema sp. FACHB-956]